MELCLLVSLNHDFNFIHCRPEFQAASSRTIIWTRRECLERLVLVGEHSLFKALHEFEAHYMAERPHQGIGNRLIEPKAQHTSIPPQQDRPLEWECRQRLGGLLKSYSRKAA